MESLFKDFLDNYDGFSVSFRGRKEQLGADYDQERLTYGEPKFECINDFLAILQDLCRCDKTETMIDLGSGLGKIVIPMHYANIFKNIEGVELITSLYNESLKIIDEYSKKYQKNVDNIKMINDDMFNIDFSKYDVIFSNTAVSEQLKDEIVSKINKEAKNCCIIISSISTFKDENIIPLRKLKSQWSWGLSSVCVSRKVKNI